MIICTIYRHNSATLHAVKLSYLSLELSRVISGIGTLRLELLESDAQDIPLQPDLRIVVERSVPAVGQFIGYSAIIGTYLLCGWERSQRASDRRITLIGQCLNSLLARRIVAYAAGSSQADKSGAADNVIKAIVRENLGTSAGSGRDISAYGIDVEPDLSLASTVQVGIAYGNVYDAVNRIADIYAATYGTRLVWDCVPQGEGWSAQFIARLGGIRDLTMSGANPLWIGVESGALQSARLVYDRRGGANYIYAGGQGEGMARQVVTASDANDIAWSPIARTEAFYDATHLTTNAHLTSAAAQRLYELLPRQQISIEMVETPQMQYGRELRVGDMLTVRAGFGEYNVLLRSVRIYSDKNTENVSFLLES